MSNIKVRVGAQPAVKVLANGAIPTLFIKLFDVDATDLTDGVIAVYHASTQKFVTQKTLNLDSLTVTDLTVNGQFGLTDIDGGVY
jgi:hypothetical protein